MFSSYFSLQNQKEGLKHVELIPPLILDIFIYGEEKHVGEEDAEAAEEMPNVVEVVEVEE